MDKPVSMSFHKIMEMAKDGDDIIFKRRGCLHEVHAKFYKDHNELFSMCSDDLAGNGGGHKRMPYQYAWAINPSNIDFLEYIYLPGKGEEINDTYEVF